MKYADKLGFEYTMVLGDNELASGKATLRNMHTGAQTEISLGDGFAEKFYAMRRGESLEAAADAAESFGKTEGEH